MPRKRKGVTAAQQRERVKKQQNLLVNSQLRSNQDQSEVLCSIHKPDACKVVSGTFHQGDTRFQFPGVQCAYISLMALIRMNLKEPQSWTSGDIDTCVVDGNSRFIKHCEALDIQPKMLMANELPNEIHFPENSFVCNQFESNIQCGLLNPSMCDISQCIGQSIDKALLEGLNNSQSFLFFCGGLTIAIAKVETLFYAFDPHSRGKDGLLEPNGTAVLMVFCHPRDLVCYIEKLFLHSLELEPSEQFELVPLTISQVSTETPKYRLDACSRNAMTIDCTSSNTRESLETIASVEKPQKTPDYIDTNCLNSIESYFKDQQKRQKLFQDQRSDVVDTKVHKKNEYMKTYMKRRREKEAIRKKENESARARMQDVRSTYEGKKKNRERSVEGMRKLNQTIDGRKKHNKMSAETMRKRLCTDEGRSKHNERSAESMRNMLKDDKKRLKHNEKSAESLKKMLLDETKKQKRTEKSVEAMKRMLSNEEKKQQHNKKAVESKRRTLENEQQKKIHREISADAMRRMLQDEQKKQKHKMKSFEAKKRMLADEQKKLKHNEKSAESMRKFLQNDEKRQIHRKRTADGMKKMLSFESKRQEHREKSAQRMKIIRKRHTYNNKEYILKKKRKTGVSFEEAVDRFEEAIKDSCSYICSSCNQTWFKHSVRLVSSVSKNIESSLLKQCVTGYLSIENEEWICNTYIHNLRQGNIPRLSVVNGMKFPHQIPELKLNSLEERLISLRIPFMQIRALNSGGQFSLKGSVVNVPTEIEPTIRALPRFQNESETIPIKLKRMKELKGSVVTENVRPAFVLNALKTLRNTSDFYKEANISIDENWTANDEETVVDETEPGIRDSTNDESDGFSEVEDEAPLMTFLDDQTYDKNSILSVAPGEGQRPLQRPLFRVSLFSNTFLWTKTNGKFGTTRTCSLQ